MATARPASVPARNAKRDVLSSLKAMELVAPKAALPAEIIAMILDYLDVPDLLRCARVSKRLQEMVYDDTRWVQRLRDMGCWDEAEARKASEESSGRTRQSRLPIQPQIPHGQASRNGGTTLGRGGPGRPDVPTPSESSKEPGGTTSQDGSLVGWSEAEIGNVRGAASLTDASGGGKSSSGRLNPQDPRSILQILRTVRSTRGFARQEYGRVYSVLTPLYLDIASSGASPPVIFRTYSAPEEQAKMLAQLRTFAKADVGSGAEQREHALIGVLDAFETAALREFQHGLQAGDVGVMRRYAQVLVILNGGFKAVETFARRHPLLQNKREFGQPMDCFNQGLPGEFNAAPSQDFFQRLLAFMDQQRVITDQVFPPSANAFFLFLGRIAEDTISDYVTAVFDEAHRRKPELYVKAVSGVYQQARAFTRLLQPAQDSPDHFHNVVKQMLGQVFEPHVELYLREELDLFRRKASSEVSVWEQKLSEQDASTESFFMSNINRQAAKKDFLTSFKKVVMMPVTVLPSFPLYSPFTSSRSVTPNNLEANGAVSQHNTRPSLHGPSVTGTVPSLGGRAPSPGIPGMPLAEAPTTELAAKAAIMNSRLEGIKTLFSIEVALNLVHAAKGGLERAAVFIDLGGRNGEEAKQRCQAIFIQLLQILGSKHVKPGFDKAVDHLSKYNPRHVSEHNQPGVAPLVTFLELVNVGDLIQQMVDVFYEQELIATKLVDRDNFLDAAAKEKKRFEQMLDERVAAGLNTGIDVLMDEVEYLFATTQLATDFNPPVLGEDSPSQALDIGPTQTARRVVEVVSAHTKMLVGSTDKHMLDVFNQEVGLRIFNALCKHIKKQRISTSGSVMLISDMNHYFTYIQTIKNNDLLQYFKALRELSQIYLIDGSHGKELAAVIADGDRFYGILRAEDVYEFAERRADWFQIKKSVERAMYGIGCLAM